MNATAGASAVGTSSRLDSQPHPNATMMTKTSSGT
jgi:hypothetical protein